MSKICALVAAAGSGTRACLPYPKTLFPIQGKPILIRVAELLAPYDLHPTIIVSPNGQAQIQECLNASGVAAASALQCTNEYVPLPVSFPCAAVVHRMHTDCCCCPLNRFIMQFNPV